VAVKPIRLYPDPVLRVRCPDVTVFDDRLQTLAQDMIDTMHAAPGVGLAAPQVGHEERIAVVDVTVGEKPGELYVLVNPQIVGASGSSIDSEGCLSIPEFTEKVERPESLTVTAQRVDGTPFELRAEGFLARAIAHEVDHLNGVLFVDHLRGLRRERARRFLRRMARSGEEVA
jgi:peptide deformylase